MSCPTCRFYDSNPLLHCAVHPEAPNIEDCADWEARSPNSNVVDLNGLTLTTVQGFVHLDMEMVRQPRRPEHLSGEFTINIEITPETRESLINFVTAVNEAAQQACQSFLRVGVSLEEAQAAIQKLSDSSPSVSDIRNAIARLATAPPPEDPRDAAIQFIATRHRVSRAIATFRFEDFLSRHPHVTPQVAYDCLMDRRIRFRFGRLTPGKGFPKPKGDRRGFRNLGHS